MNHEDGMNATCVVRDLKRSTWRDQIKTVKLEISEMILSGLKVNWVRPTFDENSSFQEVFKNWVDLTIMIANKRHFLILPCYDVLSTSEELQEELLSMLLKAGIVVMVMSGQVMRLL